MKNRSFSPRPLLLVGVLATSGALAACDGTSPTLTAPQGSSVGEVRFSTAADSTADERGGVWGMGSGHVTSAGTGSTGEAADPVEGDGSSDAQRGVWGMGSGH